jgi:hypothetical protein
MRQPKQQQECNTDQRMLVTVVYGAIHIDGLYPTVLIFVASNHRGWNSMEPKARLPRIRLQVYLLGRVEALLGYLVTDGKGDVWAIPEMSKNHHAATRAVAYRLDMTKIDKTPVAGRPDQFIAYRDLLFAPEMIDGGNASG